MSGPEAVGENVTCTVHDAPAASDDGQLVFLEKSPLALIAETFTADALKLVTVTTSAWLVVPTSWLGNVKLEGVRRMALVRATRRLPAGASR